MTITFLWNLVQYVKKMEDVKDELEHTNLMYILFQNSRLTV